MKVDFPLTISWPVTTLHVLHAFAYFSQSASGFEKSAIQLPIACRTGVIFCVFLVSFCPPNSLKSITNSINFAHSLGMGRRQLHAGEEGQGGNFGNTRESYREQWSLIGPYFQINSQNNFRANQSVVDSNHCT